MFKIIIVAALLLIGLIPTLWISSGEEIQITVNKTERITTSDSEGKTSSMYMVYTDSETFKNVDVLFLGKFDSSDLHGKLKEGKTYKVKVYGWRFPFLSTYRNVIKIIE